MRQEELSIRYTVHLRQDALVVEPAGKTFDAALRLGPRGPFRRDCGQLRALAGHDAADQRRQGGQVPSALTLEGAWLRLS